MSSNTSPPGRLRAGWEALQQTLTQSVQTVSKRPRVHVRNGGVDEVDLASNIAEWYALFEETPLIHSSLRSFASDVVQPGYRIAGEDDRAVEYLEETWAPQAAIIAGEKHNDLLGFLKQTTIQRWGRGGGLVEHVRPGPESDEITGVTHIKPETVKALTLPDKNILIGPEDTDIDGLDVRLTNRGEAAAYVQWHDDALFGSFDDKDEVLLSQNDVTRTLLNPDVDSLWGTPVTKPIAEDVKGFKEILRANEQAIKGKAWGVWSVAFGRDVLEYEDQGQQTTEIIEWSDADQDNFIENQIDDLGPGEIVGHDGTVEFEKFEGEVPDVIDHLEFYVDNITTALPTPKFTLGFEQGINQFVTENQDQRYQQIIGEEREALERAFTPLLQQVVERNVGIENADVRLKLEPKRDESPILSMSDEEVDRLGTYATALKQVSGAADPATLVNDETLRDLILQLPDEAAPADGGEIDEDDPRVQDAVDEIRASMNGDGGGTD